MLQSTSENVTYTNWGANEPNNGNSNEHCAYMRDDGHWNDIVCSIEKWENGRNWTAVCELWNIFWDISVVSSSIPGLLYTLRDITIKMNNQQLFVFQRSLKYVKFDWLGLFLKVHWNPSFKECIWSDGQYFTKSSVVDRLMSFLKIFGGQGGWGWSLCPMGLCKPLFPSVPEWKI